MKKRSLLLFVALGMLLYSCKKNENKPVADFTFSGENNPIPCEVFFSNSSTNATSYNWEFGDGTSSTENNTKHIYTTFGTYNVKLTATGKGGSHSVTKSISFEKPKTQLSLAITQQPVGGSQVKSLFLTFEGNVTGTVKPIIVTAEWWFEPSAGGGAPQLKSSVQYTFDSAHKTSKSTVYSAPSGYVFVNYYYVKLTWTDDGGQHSLQSNKVYCY